ncbi:MAG TPA: bis(5'-nucleosyl)-tetraphosphatase (symmetrical) YqeK, partial [Clostridia bacterium]|nr:bis(5'-nucleosyl)-tetraphosphatase (symmetrical) YqeK [Clostridia bacterium]
ISSSAVRAAIAKALPVKGLVPPSVENYIYENALYVTEYFKSIQESCRSGLSSGRYLHTIGVMKTALELAAIYGADANKAKLAALLHDCGRSLDKGALSHAEKSELLAREKYQVADKEVLKAIRLHTTLDEGASLLDKIIYLADMIEPNRKFQGVEELRALAMQNLDKAVMEGLRRTIGYVKTRHLELSNKSQRALIWLEAELKLNPTE